ncbi:hypothetical protein C3B59_01955 [Cryobacterium zongtaii]|uniref:WxL domain-containing protein n=1 Tax=Cryobacterium zongtaii TaxID=1259217 RepID=A0A2S3ZQ63_9MICO|nr:hypothetical protein [Cryobacterium zongtaii]POH71368.1 hypothetical protein C3B59_01955 [Cryobacterium zongtaii]
MKVNNTMRLLAVGAVSIALVGAAVAPASAATSTEQINGSDAPYYVYDTNAELVTNPATVFGWESDNFAAGTPDGYDTPRLCPAEADGVSVFLSDVGNERNVQLWKATALSGFNPGTKEVLAATLTPITLINGLPGQAAVKTAGGRYSLGIACTIYNGVTTVASYYRTINVTAGTGDYTIEAQADKPVPEVPAEPTSTTKNIALAPTIVAPTNGVLSLEVPTGAAATFVAPTLVNNVSTTTGTLGAVTVNDGRFLTREGWDLTANVIDFKNSLDATNTISKSQLGIAPSVTAAGTVATGVTAAAAQVAGSATYPAAFASAAAANTTGLSVLNAGLTFVAPQVKAAGTYTSTLTLTVVSK